jgi:hypothetical protein
MPLNIGMDSWIPKTVDAKQESYQNGHSYHQGPTDFDLAAASFHQSAVNGFDFPDSDMM